MTRNEARFGVIGTIGSGSELRPLPRKNPTNSYHAVIDGEEKLIRYDYSFIPPSLAYKKTAYILCKPILLQEDPDLRN